LPFNPSALLYGGFKVPRRLVKIAAQTSSKRPGRIGLKLEEYSPVQAKRAARVKMQINIDL